MAKGKNELTSPAEDYVDQLNWRANHVGPRGGWRNDSVHNEPKWKYKIAYRYPPITVFNRIMGVVILLGILTGVIFLITSDTLTIEAKIFIASLSALFILVIVFAVRDASKDSDDDSNLLD